MNHTSVVVRPVIRAEARVKGRVKARVDVHGSWSAVMRTLMLAEILPYQLNVSRVRIDTSGTLDAKSGGRSEWRTSFSIDAVLVHD